jgi:hypothetical protein
MERIVVAAQALRKSRLNVQRDSIRRDGALSVE